MLKYKQFLEKTKPRGQRLFDEIDNSKYSKQLHAAWLDGNINKIKTIIDIFFKSIKNNIKTSDMDLILIYMGYSR